ncbi:MAG: GNAT family N-acetyltransferase [Eubacterium sp.]|nr:GNAT family N-acetyltransferase [Eubacterium sp.]
MITYREMRQSDIPALLDMIWKMWAGPKVKAKPGVAIHYAEMVLYYELLNSTVSFVADDNGRAAGVCVLDIKDGHPMHTEYLMKMIDAVAAMSKDPDGLENLKHSTNANRVFKDSEEVLEGKNYGAEVALFILDDQHRGQGIGSGMFNHIANYLNDHGVEKFYLHSDESSYHHFYGDHRGMDLLDSRPSDGSLGAIDNVTLYIYADDVKDQMHL